jgi:cell division protein FtsB
MSELVTWVTHGFRQQGVAFDTRAMRWMLALILLIGLLAGTRLFLVSYVVAAGRQLQDTRAELTHLQQENARLEMEIARRQVPGVLLERAEQMGLRPADRVEFVELQE